MTMNETMEKIEDKRFDAMHKISQLKHLLVDEIFDAETTKMINDQISKTEKELKDLSTKE